jgi:hypothetical protein
VNDYLTVLQLFGGYAMPDDIIDNTPPISYDELTPEEQDIVDHAGEEGVIPFETYIQEYVDRFGHEPHIKDPSSFVLWALSDFTLDEFRMNAVEVTHESP